MQPFLPNSADAAITEQAEPDSTDFEVLSGAVGALTGVVSSCVVSEDPVTPDMTVDVAAGEIRVDGKPVTVSAQANNTITAADGSNLRIDLVSLNSSGTVVVTDGTPAAEPVAPSVPADSVALAFVYVPASDTAITDAQVVDKRRWVAAATVFDVLEYGATGDGSTDDRASIQAAIDAAGTAGGGVVYFPSGTYYVTKDGANAWCLTAKDDVTLLGADRESAVIQTEDAASNSTRILYIDAVDNVTVRSLGFDGNDPNVTGSGQEHSIMVINGSTFVTINDCHFFQSTGDGIYLYECSDITIKGNRIETYVRNGVTLGGNGGERVDIEGNRIISDKSISAAQTIDSEPTGGVWHEVTIRGNTLSVANLATSATHITTSGEYGGDLNTGWVIDSNVILDGTCQFNASRGVRFTNNVVISDSDSMLLYMYRNTEDMVVANNYFKHTGALAGARFQASVSGGEVPIDLKFIDNHIDLSGSTLGSDGMFQLWGCNRVLVRGNTLLSNGTNVGIYVRASALGYPMEDIQILDNTIKNCGASGVLFYPSADTIDRVVVAGNTFADDQGTPTMTNGVRFLGDAADVTNVRVENNVQDGNLTGSLVADDFTTGDLLVTREVGGVYEYVGTGTPESVVSAPVGSRFYRIDGGTSTTLYVKESGTGTTGWRQASVAASETSGTDTLDWTDSVVNVDTSGGAATITLPDNATYDGKNYLIRRDGASAVTINRAGSDTFDDAATSKTLGSDSASIGILSIGDGEWKIVGTSGTVT